MKIARKLNISDEYEMSDLMSTISDSFCKKYMDETYKKLKKDSMSGEIIFEESLDKKQMALADELLNIDNLYFEEIYLLVRLFKNSRTYADFLDILSCYGGGGDELIDGDFIVFMENLMEKR